MTRAQLAAARERVAGVLEDPRVPLGILGKPEFDALCSRLVTAVLGHPDGRAPRAKLGPEAQRVAHLPRRARR